MLQKIKQSGDDGFLIGDQNGRIGTLQFTSKNYEDNIGRISNAQGLLLASIYNQCSFYPINHLIVDDYAYPGNFTFIKGGKKSQIDFFFTNNYNSVKYFYIEEKANKDTNTEMHNLIKRAHATLYVTHYKKLETQYINPKEAFEHINKEHYTKT